MVKPSTVKLNLIKRAKRRAKKKLQPFNLIEGDITIPLYCPILGIELQVNPGMVGGRFNSPTLDRIDNAKGYEPTNVWVISQLANQMKSSATPGQLRAFGKWIVGEYGSELS